MTTAEPPRDPDRAIPRSALPGIVWPGVPTPAGATMLALQWQLQRSQWWPRDQLLEQQFRQLRILAAHAVARVPHYRRHLAHAGVSRAADLSPENYLRWPVLTRREVQDSAAALRASTRPREHGAAVEVYSSGSTSEPVCVLGTEAARFFADALVVRDHLWQRRHLAEKYAAIRFNAAEGGQPGWSRVTNAAFDTGTAASLDVSTDVPRQLEWLIAEQPSYLLTTPSNLRALLEHSRAIGRRPHGLRQAITYAEMLPDGLRETVRALWDADLVDTYSCREFGPIALQCPDAPGYHAQAEHLYVEIVREDGSACMPGETGRVIVTALHEFAMPLLRYDLGDLAEAGGPCACGRGLPVLRRIVGRVRNMARDASGRRFQPGIDGPVRRSGVPLRQIQMVQHAPDRMELRYVMERDLTPAEARRLHDELARSFGYPFEIAFSRVSAVERSPGGKFESFLSLLTDD